MATGGVWTLREVILCIVVCVAHDVCGGRRTQAKIEAILTSGASPKLDHEHVLVAGEETVLEVWGLGLSKGLEAGLTAAQGVQGAPCQSLITPPLIPNTDTVTHKHAVFTVPAGHTGHIPVISTMELWLCTREQHTFSSGRARHTGGWVHQGPPSRVVLVVSPKLALDSPRRVHHIPRRAQHKLSLRSVDRASLAATTPPHVANTTVAGADAHGDAAVTHGEAAEVTHGDAAVTTVESDGEVEVTTPLPVTKIVGDGAVAGIQGEELTDGKRDGGIDSGVEDTSNMKVSELKREVEEAKLKKPGDIMLGDMPSLEPNGSRTSNAEPTTVKTLLRDEIRTNAARAGVRASEKFVEGGRKEVDLGDDLMNIMKEELGAANLDMGEGWDDNPGSDANTDATVTTAGAAVRRQVRIIGLRVESHTKGIEYEGFTGIVLANEAATVRFFGEGMNPSTEILFTANQGDYGTTCGASTTRAFKMSDLGDGWATANIDLPSMRADQKFWYLCVRDSDQDLAYHQGNDPWITMSSYNLLLPLWIQAVFLVVLLLFSGLFSGLNLGLMALDKTELKIVSNTGSPDERRYARAIEPVRRHGNFLLCTLLLGNVLVNSSLTILLDNLSSGLIAVIGSTIAIVVFGEIIPQAICSRHGLAIGARVVWLVRVLMVITAPAAYPISKMLDCVLGEEIGNTYDRERLKELIKVTHDHNDLKKEEQNIICGALELHKKTVGEVMTKLDDVYMLSVDTILDFNTINEIMQQGYSRVPVFEGERTNIIAVLFIKDLAFIDPDDNTPLRTLSQFYQNPCNFVFVDTTLDVMFKEFKEGAKGHMAFVHQVNNEGDCDPFYEVLGLVTLEDVIEELIQEEIVDETDVFTDNRTKRRRLHIGRPDFTEFSHPANQPNLKRVQISPQLQVAALQYLRTSIEPFKEGQLSEMIVKKLLNQDVIHSIKLRNKEHSKTDQHTFIYTQGKPVDFFVLILEGHVEVTIGRENLTFESGPFTYFGLAALSQAQTIGESPSASTQLSKGSMVGSVQSLDSTKFTFLPDYSVRAITEVMYLKIRNTHYIAARRAYLLEQAQREPLGGENFENEIAKMLIEDEGPNSPTWENTPVTARNPKFSGMANGSTVHAFEESEDIEMAIQNLMTSDQEKNKSSAATNGGLKNSISVPGTPISDHSQISIKPSCSFQNLQDVPALESNVNVHSTQKNDKKPLISEIGNISFSNNLSTSSIEDNGEQKVVGSPDVMPNMNSHASLDYKQSNLDSEGVFAHKRKSSFS
ncbi:unextended protein [Procambarus clarkii]|uniref:unextended protein n=1 Tax=Procambarus clarkii TaxID=6728 RepID=UPI001E6768FC|nr:unextended protein-like [Procambarus clarkii]